MANGFMPTNTGIGTIPPELFAQQQQLNRQQQLAQMLLQQGQQQPQGQMVSGRFVAPSFFQYATPLAQTFAATRMQEKGDKAAIDLAEALRKNRMQEAEAIMGAKTPEEQLKLAMGGYSPLSQQLAGKLIERKFKEPKWEKVDRLDARGNTVTGMIDVNSAQPEMTFREIGVSKPAISVAEAARLSFDNIPFGGGMPNVSGQPNVAGQPSVSAMPTSTMPQAGIQTIPTQGGANPAVNMAGLSPRQQQELRGKLAEDFQKNFKNAQDALPVIKEAELLLPKSSSGGLQAGFTYLTKQAGISTDMSKADAQLKILGAKLTAQVPRFEGPQSNVDVQAYREAAGAIADSTIPYADRMAALNTVKQLQAKYAPDLYAKEFPNMGTIGTPKQETAPKSKTPKVGDVLDGFRFKGGNPSLPSSWEKV